MLPIHTILHPTDFSDRSTHALRLAGALARDYGARLIVLHVAEMPAVPYAEGVIPPVDPDDVVRVARHQLELLDAPVTGHPVERHLEVGDPIDTILGVAHDLPADLIVMGTHGRTGLRRLLMGSVAEQIVRRATCPVLTMTSPFAAAETEPQTQSALAGAV
ncbi:MAG TPA: universal stress protein, partial [Acidimicrobiales bacterium]|nr:universal stress protein [Acidimicrobiales bacterium]